MRDPLARMLRYPSLRVAPWRESVSEVGVEEPEDGVTVTEREAEEEGEGRGKEPDEIPWLLVRDDGAPRESEVAFLTRVVPVLTLAERTRAAESRRESEGCSGSIFSHKKKTKQNNSQAKKKRRGEERRAFSSWGQRMEKMEGWVLVCAVSLGRVCSDAIRECQDQRGYACQLCAFTNNKQKK